MNGQQLIVSLFLGFMTRHQRGDDNSGYGVALDEAELAGLDPPDQPPKSWELAQAENRCWRNLPADCCATTRRIYSPCLVEMEFLPNSKVKIPDAEERAGWLYSPMAAAEWAADDYRSMRQRVPNI